MSECDFCKRADFSAFRVQMDKHSANIVLAVASTRFAEDEQFKFCPECGRSLRECSENGWIKCSDRLPEKWDRVLAFCNTDGQRDVYEAWNTGFCWMAGGTRMEYTEITHWIPMPAPPTGKE